MEKKLVGLYVPAVQERFDLLVPTDLDIASLTVLLTNGVEELCGGRDSWSHLELLSMGQRYMLLLPSLTLGDYGVENGAQMVLM